jgi:hypothetical protein
MASGEGFDGCLTRLFFPQISYFEFSSSLVGSDVLQETLSFQARGARENSCRQLPSFESGAL